MSSKVRRYGSWRILRNLGEGGQAWVHRVEREDGTEGILKIIKNPGRNWRAAREFEALQRLQSVAVPRYLDHGETEERPWVVMEDCGVPLTQAFPVATVSEHLLWFRDLCTAVVDAHEAGVLHRDIKPDNIVVSRDHRRAFLVDFGICRTSQDAFLTTSNEAFGNAAFAAPECSLGHWDASGPPADIYSCGKVLYWLVSGGQFMFRENLTVLLAGSGTMHPSLTARVFSAIHHCVRLAPADRPTAVQLLERASEIVEYDAELRREEAGGLVRLLDTFRNGDRFNPSASRSVESTLLNASDLVGSVVIGGGPPGNLAQAQQFANSTGGALSLRRMCIAISVDTENASIALEVVRDADGSPSTEVLGRIELEIPRAAARVCNVDCDTTLAPGTFWLVVRATNRCPTYVSLYCSEDDWAPQGTTLAESYDGGRKWQVRQSAGGGFAIRLEATVENAT